MQQRALNIWLITFILLAAVALYIQELDNFSMTIDEGWTTMTADAPTLEILADRMAKDVHPPLYYALLNFWQDLVGFSPFAMRYLGMLFTFLATASIYQLGNRLSGKQNLGGIAAVIFFLANPMTVELGREVRHYGLAITFAIMTLTTYWHFWNKQTVRRGVAFAVAGVGLLWTMYWGGFFLVSLGVHALLTRRKQLHLFMAPNLAIAVLYIPWWPKVIDMLGRREVTDMGQTLPTNQAGITKLTRALFGEPTLFWIAIFIVGLLYIKSKSQSDKAAVIFLGTTFTVFIGASLLINLHYTSLSRRSTSIIVPVMALILAHAVTRFRGYARGAILVPTVLILISVIVTIPPARRISQWSEVTDFIAEHSTSDDVIMMPRIYDDFTIKYYIRMHPDLDVNQVVSYYLPESYSRSEEITQLISEDYDDVWLIEYGKQVDGVVFWDAGLHYVFEEWWDTRVGPIMISRYERVPPTPAEIFGETLQLEDYQIISIDDGLSINFFWNPLIEPPANYVFSTFLLNSEGTLVIQNDNAPLNNSTSTLDWTSDRYYYDNQVLSTQGLAPGTYYLGLQVYSFLDAEFTQIEHLIPQTCAADDCKFIILETIELE